MSKKIIGLTIAIIAMLSFNISVAGAKNLSSEKNAITAPHPALRYDLNSSGRADYNDAIHIGRFIVGLEKSCPLERCDLTGDGTVSNLDATRLAQALIVIYDLNNDGMFSSLDPQHIARFKVGLEKSCPMERCDLTGDGTISNLDATWLAQILQTFPS